MSPEEHRQRHQELHEAFDELLADFLVHNQDALPSKTPIVALMKWSHLQTTHPDDSKGGRHGR